MLALIFGVSFVTACDDDTDPVDMADDDNAVEYLTDANTGAQFTSLVAALQKVEDETNDDLVTALGGNGPFTIFAPTDAAFSAFLSDMGFNSLDDVPVVTLSKILQYHVIGGLKVTSSQINNGTTATTLAGEDMDNTLTFTLDGNSVMINGSAMVTDADNEVENGVIHVIDEVLMMPSMLNAVEYVTNSAYGANFSSLVAAILRLENNSNQEDNLVATLSSDGPFTIFAPTNQAFADLLSSGAIADSNEDGTVNLDDIDDATLYAVLTHHVLGKEVLAGGITNNATEQTVGGTTLTFMVDGNGVMIDNGDMDATVTMANVMISNGVIHVINKVLLPPM